MMWTLAIVKRHVRTRLAKQYRPGAKHGIQKGKKKGRLQQARSTHGFCALLRSDQTTLPAPVVTDPGDFLHMFSETTTRLAESCVFFYSEDSVDPNETSGLVEKNHKPLVYEGVWRSRHVFGGCRKLFLSWCRHVQKVPSRSGGRKQGEDQHPTAAQPSWIFARILSATRPIVVQRVA